ncbi:MAG: glucose-6-phosphate dehydrogenase [Kiritimatiellae bacterium]|nr:glucose-6-phosphate dehydrogenase [Kiritimatiellia bacterium]MDW8458513.1 glucose-6-phosphate dehydrogenase [Verrucomicrobiota bacterium]
MHAIGAPFVTSANLSVRVTDPATIVIFGASGDLARRKLLPALYAMHVQRLLPDNFAIFAVARREYTDESYRGFVAESLHEFSRIRPDPESLQDFCRRVFYHPADISLYQAYRTLRTRLFDRRIFPPNHVFYLSVKPELFHIALENLRAAGLVQPPDGDHWSRAVIEKPFGRDLDSARLLNRVVLQHLDESQVYRIDHYLGKETVQNILSFRFANAIFEPLFNSHLVDHIQITVAETVGMESGRGAYYDASGALRDMLQNHMLQLLCLVAMEPPSGLTAHALRNEKVKVLQSIRPFSREELTRSVVRAQYTAGADPSVPGYLAEERIPSNSTTETYVALRLHIDNWRWAGTPIFLRTGKRMARRLTEIAIQFKKPPLQWFQLVECVGDVCDLSRASPNLLVFRIQPDEGISLRFAAKRPVPQILVENVTMEFSYSSTWQRQLPEAYERLLLDVLRGDSTLFMRSDEVESAWAVVDPILRAWQEDPSFPLATYPAGSWGPPEADALFLHPDQSWRNPAGT